MSEEAEYQMMSIRFPCSTMSLLRKAAVERAIREKTRISVGATLLALIERHRSELETV